MSAINLRLPESLHEAVRELAEKDRISINTFITLAVAEKIAALKTVTYLEERAKRGSREKFEAVLAKIPHVEPEEHDRLD